MQHTQDTYYDGKHITVEGRKLINFGSCSYLGLDQDQRIKDAAIDAIQRYGVQFSSSRTYLSCSLYEQWESLLEKVFDCKVVLSTSVSLGHHAVIPIVVEEGDLVILDQQVHASIQEAAQRMQLKGCLVEIIRHSRLDELELKIKQHSGKVWYMIDGVYSMYGDFAPVKELVQLLDKYPHFHLYADDAHGMSIAGKNGRGVVLSQIDLHPRMILATSLNKAFAAGGGAFLIPDEALLKKVKNCGGSFIFSGPHQIPSIAAGIASAQIHLSKEIEERQKALHEKLLYCHHLLTEVYRLPVVSNPLAPITFIGLGLQRVGYNLIQRLLNDGFYTNLSIFPAVPETCTGLRFTITLHHSKEDIERLAERIAYHFPLALQQEDRSMKDIVRAFKRVADFSHLLIEVPVNIKQATMLELKHSNSIESIEEKVWNSYMNKSSLDWEALKIIESTFAPDAKNLPEHRWKFHYFRVSKNGKPIIMTYFTEILSKDDLLAPATISQKIELERKKNPYYLCSSTMLMGCMMSIGEHIYLDKTDPDWKKALSMLIDEVWKIQDEGNIDAINLRDFSAYDSDVAEYLSSHGFVKIDLPPMYVLAPFSSEDNYLKQFHSKRRYNLRREVMLKEKDFEISMDKDSANLEQLYRMYLHVADKSYQINDFEMPAQLFYDLAPLSNFEIITLRLKENRSEPVAVCFCYRTTRTYNFMMVGLDYTKVISDNVYKQAIWQVAKRASALGLEANMGLTADQSKLKFKANVVRQIAFVSMKDNYNMNIINAISAASMEV
jgi:7-keto-8-aminopelargonate synthetase-like enzyme/predicted N-acyltransferase